MKFQTGHAANLNAEVFDALPGFQPCAGGATSATINFDGARYSMAPRAVAVDSLPSRADGNESRLIINRIGGDLRAGGSPLGSLFALLYDDAEDSFSFTISGGCQILINAGCCYTGAPRFESFVPAGHTGWQKLFVAQSDVAIFGAMINFNRSSRQQSTAYNQGHNFHHLTLSSGASITIPVFPPNC